MAEFQLQPFILQFKLMQEPTCPKLGGGVSGNFKRQYTMETYADKTSKNKSQAVAHSLAKQKSNNESAFQLVDNRPETIVQKKLQESINNSPRVQELNVYQKMVDNRYSKQSKPIQKMENTIGVIQKVHKDIPSPNKEQVLLMDFLNQRNHEIVKRNKLESRGTHGTNWMHAISIMQGIKSQVPKEMRTSDVTPEEGGFFVDISATGKDQSHDFAKMAAYGTQEEATPPFYKDDQQKRDAFEKHAENNKGTRKAIILEIWGPKEASPEARKKGQQSNEDIYRANAHHLVATLKDSL